MREASCALSRVLSADGSSPIRKSSSRSWNCPWMSPARAEDVKTTPRPKSASIDRAPQTVTGQRTAETLDSSCRISLAFSQSAFTSSSWRCLQFISRAIWSSRSLWLMFAAIFAVLCAGACTAFGGGLRIRVSATAMLLQRRLTPFPARLRSATLSRSTIRSPTAVSARTGWDAFDDESEDDASFIASLDTSTAAGPKLRHASPTAGATLKQDGRDHHAQPQQPPTRSSPFSDGLALLDPRAWRPTPPVVGPDMKPPPPKQLFTDSDPLIQV